MFFSISDPDPSTFLKRIRIQLKQICKKSPHEEFSGVERQKSKKLTIITNFLAFLLYRYFFLVFLLNLFPPGPGSAQIHNPEFLKPDLTKLHGLSTELELVELEQV